VLLIRAASTILQPMGITEMHVKQWVVLSGGYSCAPWQIPASKLQYEAPIYHLMSKGPAEGPGHFLMASGGG
jgi:hypothetical protein